MIEQTPRIRIAIVDRQPILRDGLRGLLEQEYGFQVVAEAGNDEEAMEAVHQHRPDLVLIEGADRRGFSVLERMQDESPKIKTIALTAADEEFTIVRAMKHGASGIVFKSMSTERLIEAIRKVHEGGVWLDARCQATVMGELRSPGRAVSAGSPLTPRENQVVDLVAKGYRNRDIAAALFITQYTVRGHIHRIFRKLNVSDRIHLALFRIEGYPLYRQSEAGVRA